MTTLSDYQIMCTKYKWEFLRRNKRYVRDFREFQKFLKQNEDITPETWRFKRKQDQFCQKWKLGFPLNPEMNYENYLKYSCDPDLPDGEEDLNFAPGDRVLSKGLDVHRLMFELLNPTVFFSVPIKVKDGWAYKHDGDTFHRYIPDRIAETGKLKIEIDLNFSKNRLIKEFKILLDEWKTLYEDAYMKKLFRFFCKERNIHSFPIEENFKKEFEKIYRKNLNMKKSKYEKKYHFDNFDDYLKVYDLKKEGKSWAEIAKSLKLNSVQTARNHYKAACGIAAEGIDLYVK